jgi:hypothetical protein
VALRRRDDRELEYQIGDPVVSEGLNYWPPWVDPQVFYAGTYDGVGGVGGVLSLQPMWDDRIRYGGWSNFPYRITGIVQDSGGTPISNAVCSLFRTSDNQFMYSAVSKDGGQYDFGVDDTVTRYYIVAYRAGPDLEGTTSNQLVGS